MNKTVFVEFDFNVPYLEFAYEKVDQVICEHNSLGYKVISVTPITASAPEDDVYPKSQYYVTFTKGVFIVFEKI